ncbi:MAG TPA: PhoU domain-containing protein [Ktedonobacterales bacterium]
MAQTAGPNDELPEALSTLASDTTELGIVVGEMFQYAAASLFGQEPEAARYAMQTRAWVTQSVSILRRRSLQMIQRYAPQGDDLRHIAELQQAASEYARIAERAGHVAEHALHLDGRADSLLASIHAGAPDLMRAFISEIIQRMQGVFLVTAARNMPLAEQLISGDADIEALYQRIRALLDWRIRNDPFHALPVQRLLIVTSDVRQIGTSIVAMCAAATGNPGAGRHPGL